MLTPFPQFSCLSWRFLGLCPISTRRLCVYMDTNNLVSGRNNVEKSQNAFTRTVVENIRSHAAGW